MAVDGTADGQEPGVSTVKSSTKAMAFGNAIFGGGGGRGHGDRSAFGG